MRRASSIVLFSTVALSALALVPASAHEERAVAGLDAEIGWLYEPPTTGVLNAVVFRATRAGKPVTDADLTVQVSLAGATSPGSALEPSDEAPGTYTAPFIPTRPGGYSFHLTGTAGTEPVDVTVQPGKGLEEVHDAGELQFPTGDPTIPQLADRAIRVDARIAAAAATARSAKTIGVSGLIVGVLGVLLALFTLRRRRKEVS